MLRSGCELRHNLNSPRGVGRWCRASGRAGVVWTPRSALTVLRLPGRAAGTRPGDAARRRAGLERLRRGGTGEDVDHSASYRLVLPWYSPAYLAIVLLGGISG